MEAPIPASALIHSATLVSAGVYLLLRFSNLIFISNMYLFVGLLGAATACYGAVVSAAQTDCKKLLAYSTISHCGFLFVTIALNNVALTVTYLYLHGFFKALTFFCVGNIVRFCKGSQDTRRMGALFLFLPVESILLTLCAINLGALPFTVGFYYKHFFQVLVVNSPQFVVLLPFLFLGMVCSAIYVFRLVFYSLFDVYKGAEPTSTQAKAKANDSDKHSNSAPLSTIFIFYFLILCIYLFNYYFARLAAFDGLSAADKLLLINSSSLSSQIASVLCFIYFYGLFGAVAMILITAECRAEFSSLKTKYMLLYLSVFLSIIFVMFSCIFII